LFPQQRGILFVLFVLLYVSWSKHFVKSATDVQFATTNLMHAWTHLLLLIGDKPPPQDVGIMSLLTKTNSTRVSRFMSSVIRVHSISSSDAHPRSISASLCAAIENLFGPRECKMSDILDKDIGW
tara:strand:+ start:88 stop:462 length:375 start_codon:yes stop_codon:yes gene_type:complete